MSVTVSLRFTQRTRHLLREYARLEILSITFTHLAIM
ncbi:hypothetical protein N802_06195 [Knoellia sinensis KCTC 19936]|uniref:Uncharacterized protein n=1 Tax=Knoellia sinensis KCTC 19936 TaxID=1385520 RepID=A0A0A0J5A3_9MICO|nr:hypothetical protein N802_06195 [Knoellia sinensis KCTC 19936]